MDFNVRYGFSIGWRALSSVSSSTVISLGDNLPRNCHANLPATKNNYAEQKGNRLRRNILKLCYVHR